jgi:DNA (cytosine-5)-methyltransferase 1
MKVLDLFSGIGGFSIGLERAGMETICFCEIEDYPRKVLKKRWPNIPIASDVKTLNYKNGVLYDREEELFRGTIDVICGGYPCQPFSLAGKRRGEDDDRHLWPEYLRLIREIKPRVIVGENVVGHINMGFDTVLSDLENEGYTWEAYNIPACSVGGYHKRERLWLVAYNHSNTIRQQQEPGFEQQKTIATDNG